MRTDNKNTQITYIVDLKTVICLKNPLSQLAKMVMMEYNENKMGSVLVHLNIFKHLLFSRGFIVRWLRLLLLFYLFSSFYALNIFKVIEQRKIQVISGIKKKELIKKIFFKADYSKSQMHIWSLFFLIKVYENVLSCGYHVQINQ